jgi:hypothetical protein
MPFRNIVFTVATDEYIFKQINVPAMVLNHLARMYNAPNFDKIEAIKAFRNKFNISLVEAKGLLEACLAICHQAEQPAATYPTWDELLEFTWDDNA